DAWVVSGSFPKFDLGPVVGEVALTLGRPWKAPKGGAPLALAGHAPSGALAIMDAVPTPDSKAPAELAVEEVAPLKVNAGAGAAGARPTVHPAGPTVQDQEGAAVDEMLKAAKDAVHDRRLFSPAKLLSPEYMDFWIDQFLDHVSRAKKTRGSLSEQEFTASLGPPCSRFPPDIVTWLLQEDEWVPVQGFAENVQARVQDFRYLVPPLLQVIMAEEGDLAGPESVKQLGGLQYRSALFLSKMHRACKARGRSRKCERILADGKPLAEKGVAAMKVLGAHADEMSRLAWIAEDSSRIELLSDWEPNHPWCCVGPLVGGAAQLKSAPRVAVAKAAEFFRECAELIDHVPNRACKDLRKDYRRIKARGRQIQCTSPRAEFWFEFVARSELCERGLAPERRRGFRICHSTPREGHLSDACVGRMWAEIRRVRMGAAFSGVPENFPDAFRTAGWLDSDLRGLGAMARQCRSKGARLGAALAQKCAGVEAVSAVGMPTGEDGSDAASGEPAAKKAHAGAAALPGPPAVVAPAGSGGAGKPSAAQGGSAPAAAPGEAGASGGGGASEAVAAGPPPVAAEAGPPPAAAGAVAAGAPPEAAEGAPAESRARAVEALAPVVAAPTEPPALATAVGVFAGPGK
ncbi:unnamed protein product, partial [Prorocentrum cordatum]